MKNVTNISYMFSHACSFNEPLNGWNTKRVENFRGTFYGATEFNQDLDKWRTYSGIK